MQKSGGDEDPTASVRGGGKSSTLGELVYVSFAVESGRGLPIKKDMPARHELVQEVKVTDVACQHGTSKLACMQIEEGVMQKFPLMPLILR